MSPRASNTRKNARTMPAASLPDATEEPRPARAEDVMDVDKHGGDAKAAQTVCHSFYAFSAFVSQISLLGS